MWRALADVAVHLPRTVAGTRLLAQICLPLLPQRQVAFVEGRLPGSFINNRDASLWL